MGMDNIHQPLAVNFFVEYCQRRGVNTSEEELEEFHQLGWLWPLALADDNTRADLWELDIQSFGRTEYHPWSDLKDSSGCFFDRSPVYFTAQVYQLLAAKDSLYVPIMARECRQISAARHNGNDAGDVAARAVEDEITQSAEKMNRELPIYEKLTEFPWLTELAIHEYRSDCAHAEPEPSPIELTEEEQYDDLLYLLG
jgi:hypothetical protein